MGTSRNSEKEREGRERELEGAGRGERGERELGGGREAEREKGGAGRGERGEKEGKVKESTNKCALNRNLLTLTSDFSSSGLL